MENNESGFCSLWTEQKRIDGCAELFLNGKFNGDYFFNRLIFDHPSCQDKRGILHKAVELFRKKGLDCYVYVLRDNELEQLLLRDGFNLLDTMSVLSGKDIEDRSEAQERVSGLASTLRINQVNRRSISIWADVFCRSFNVNNWKPEVERIIDHNFDKLILLLSFANNVPVGCAALFNKDNSTGLYCLGTISSYRGIGIGMNIVKKSLELARSQYSNYLFLQTFNIEGLVPYYISLGFKQVYNKKIFVRPL